MTSVVCPTKVVFYEIKGKKNIVERLSGEKAKDISTPEFIYFVDIQQPNPNSSLNFGSGADTPSSSKGKGLIFVDLEKFSG